MDNNPIYLYYNAIKSGRVVVSKWVRLLYNYIIKGLKKKKFHYDDRKAKMAILFIENFCHHHEGALAPQKIKLELWQKAIIACIFGIVNDKGYRQFRECLIVMGRKNGKTLLASAISEYMLFLDDYGARVYFCAPKLQQANLCYEALYQMIEKEPALKERCKKRRTDIYCIENNSSAMPLAQNAKKSDGFNPSFCVCDEIASWDGESGLKQYAVLKSALGSRLQPLILSISTSGYINDSIYDDLIMRATSLLMGRSEETSFLPLLYMIDDTELWDNMDELKKANPNLGVSVSVEFLEEEIRIAKSSLSAKAEFMTKHCNIKQNASQAWLDYEVVDKSSHKEYQLEDFRNCYAVGGIDLSQTTDLTSACIVVEKNGEEHVFAKFFMPKNKIQPLTELDKVPYDIFVQKGFITPSGENYVDYHDVLNWFVELRKVYRIEPMYIGYDRYSAQYLVDDMKQRGFRMDDVIQGWNLAPIMREFEGKLKDGNIHIGNNNLLKSHLLNVAIKYESDHIRFKPAKIKSTMHIDGFVSIIDALTVKSKYFSTIKHRITNERR